jgi:NADPH:quinone reductase
MSSRIQGMTSHSHFTIIQERKKKNMKAAYIERTGPPEVIQYGELPTPEPDGSQVLVRVKAVSVNPIDTYIRSGAIDAKLLMPYVIGCDLAGVVEAVGPEARRYRPGDRVWGSNQGLMGRQGTFAEYAAVDEAWLYPIPEGVPEQDAAAVALVGITAHLGLFGKLKLKTDETLFVTGGSGGVGSMVVQMAKIAGARVITTAGSEAKAERCRSFGADAVINYKTDNLDELLRDLAPSGLDAWWETLRQPNFELAIPHLRPRGRMVVMAGRDARPPFPVGPFYVKDCSLFGFAMFNASPEEQRQAAEDINRWLKDGRLRANIDRVLPLPKAAEAHKLQEESTMGGTGGLAGKIVLTP